MEPRIGRPGTVIKITGKALDRGHVDEVYFTDHRFDMKVKVLEQNFTQLVVRVPPFVKPGRLQLLLLTSGNQPMYLEQPWYLLVEAGDEESTPAPPAREISQKTRPTVEVAATGTQIPVPRAGAAPSPATTASLEKSVVPLKTAQRVAPTVIPTPQPADAAGVAEWKAPVEMASAKPLAESAQLPTPGVPVTNTPEAASAKPTLIPAQVLRRAPITYPSAASAQRVEGVVQLTATVRTDGRVKDIRVVRGNPLLVGSAVAAVQDWIYEPASVQGRPVESEVSILLNYKRP